MSFDDTDAHRSFALPGARLQYGPDKTVVVTHIDLDLVPDLDAQSLNGVATTSFTVLDEPIAQLTFDAVDLRVDAVSLDGKAKLSFENGSRATSVTFDPPLEPGSAHTVAFTYRTAKPRLGLFFVEPNEAYPELVRHAWTQSQDENARYWFPCLDYPHAKQSTTTRVTVPKGQFALANGALVSREDHGEKTVFAYRQDVPHSTYLMTLVVGPFAEISQGNAGQRHVPVWYYVLPGREADGERAFANTPRMIDVFEERTGQAYPYARYSQIAVSEFIFGGMENTSATTQTDRTLHDERAHIDFSSDPLVSHELAHQWFGDLLTCRDWSHAWLNEGFATYFECVWREADLGHDEYLFDVYQCVMAYLDEDSDRYRRPIVCNRYRDPIELFDRHLYQKGGAVLHMLRGALGDARFWRSIRHYVHANAQRNVETIDLIRAIEEATGRNMRSFFDQWVFRGGHPELEYALRWDEEKKTLTVDVDQKQKISDDAPAYRFDLVVRVDGRDVALQVEREHQSTAIVLEKRPDLVEIDPGAFILGPATYKLGVEFASAVLQRGDVVARIRAAKELAKDGSVAAREALGAAFETDTFWGVLEEVAVALGRTKAPWARAILLKNAAVKHPKVRRAVVAALGAFRDDEVAAALLGPAASDESYLVRAAALKALGETRDPRAFDVLVRAVGESSWNGVVAGGAARGLAELMDPRAVDPLLEAARFGKDEGLRRAAMGALARAGMLLHEQRAHIVDALKGYLDDGMFLVQLAAIAAAEQLADPAFLAPLARLSASAFDGRVRRDAMEASTRIHEAQKVPAQVTSLRSDLDALREDYRKLQEKIETLSR